MLLMSCAMAQNTTAGTATVQHMAVERDGANLQVEILLSSPVQASLMTANHPDRLVLQLPNTVCPAKPYSIEVNWKGVQRVRTALCNTNPQATQVVVDLDQAHSYALTAEGLRLVLTISPIRTSRAYPSQGAPTAGASAGLAGIFHRSKNSQLPAEVAQSEPTAPSVSGTTVPETSAKIDSNSRSATAATAPEPLVAAVPQSRPTTLSPQDSAGQFPSAQTQVDRASASAQKTVVAVAPETAAPEIITPETITPKAAAPETNAVPTPAQASSTAATDQPTLTVRSADASLRTLFRVKYVAEGVAYLDGGRSSGLTEGMKLEVEETGLPAQQGAAADPSDPRVVAELQVTAVAEPLTITHPDIKRFFMITREAVALVLQAFEIGGHGDILVLDMGEPIRILDLARNLIRLSGKSESDVEIQFTGLRDGEKLEEELFYGYEKVVPTSCDRIKRTSASLEDWPRLCRQLDELQASMSADDAASIRAKLQEIVPEYFFRPELPPRSVKEARPPDRLEAVAGHD